MRPGSCETNLIALLTNCEPALTALDAMLDAQPTTFEMTLPRKLATFAGRFWTKLTTLLTNCEPALAACAAMFETQPVTVAMTLLSQSENICGSCEIVVPRFAKKSPIA